jgi:hypothetical protein
VNDFWARNLQTAKLGLTEFPLASIRRTGGRRIARHAYPYRDGQDTEDMGRGATRWDLVVPLFRGMEPLNPLVPLYPDVYDALRFELDDPDTLGEVDFVDPEIGPVSVKVVSHTWDAVAEKRNGGMFRIQLEEVNDEPFLFSIGTLLDPDLAALDFAAELDAGFFDVAGLLDAWERFGLAVDFVFAPGELFVSMVDDFFSAIEDVALAADQIAGHIDRIRSRLDMVVNFDGMQEARRWSLYHSTVRLSASLTAAGERAAADAAQLVEFVVPWQMSHVEISVLLYADRGRSGEIVRRNPTRNPLFYPQGATLRVLDR